MIAFILFTALAIVGVAASLRTLPIDGYRAVPTDPTRLP